MKYTEFIHKIKVIRNLPLYIISGDEYFLKKQALTEIKKRFLADGGVEQGLVEFDIKNPGNARNKGAEDIIAGNVKSSSVSFSDVLNEVRTASMFGKHKLVIVEGADGFIQKYQEKLIEYVKNSKRFNCLVLNVQSLDKRTKLAKTLDNKIGILVECYKLYDRPAPWEKNKPEFDNELTKWIVAHVKNYSKTMNLKAAFYLSEKTGNDLAIVDKQMDVLSTYIGSRNEITLEDIQNLIGLSHREKLYDLLDAVGMRDTILAIKMAKKMFESGIENERKYITYDSKSIALAVLNSIHKRMRDIWNAIRVLDGGGSKENVLENTSVKRPFIDKFLKQSRSFAEKEMPEKWKYMLEADLLCKTSRLSPQLIIEQLITKLCRRMEK